MITFALSFKYIKNMKKIIYYAWAVLFGLSLSGCNSEKGEDNENEISYFKERAGLKRIKTISSSDSFEDYYCQFEHDKSGKLIKSERKKIYKHNYDDDESEKEYTYIDYYTYNHDKVTVKTYRKEELLDIFEYKLNKDGFVSVISGVGYEDGTKEFEYTGSRSYDNEGRCVARQHTAFYIPENLTDNSRIVKYGWENNLLSTIDDQVDILETMKESTYITYSYTNEANKEPIMNKAKIGTFDSKYGITQAFAEAGLWGKSAEQLPVSISTQYDNSNTSESKLDWAMDSDGYPITLTYGSYVYTFTWE